MTRPTLQLVQVQPYYDPLDDVFYTALFLEPKEKNFAVGSPQMVRVSSVELSDMLHTFLDSRSERGAQKVRSNTGLPRQTGETPG
jgi:hypothetical protein